MSLEHADKELPEIVEQPTTVSVEGMIAAEREKNWKERQEECDTAQRIADWIYETTKMRMYLASNMFQRHGIATAEPQILSFYMYYDGFSPISVEHLTKHGFQMHEGNQSASITVPSDIEPKMKQRTFNLEFRYDGNTY